MSNLCSCSLPSQLNCTGHDISREQSYIVTDLGKNPKNSSQLQRTWQFSKLDAGGKLSTQFPPGRLVELSTYAENARTMLLSILKHFLSVSKHFTTKLKKFDFFLIFQRSYIPSLRFQKICQFSIRFHDSESSKYALQLSRLTRNTFFNNSLIYFSILCIFY